MANLCSRRNFLRTAPVAAAAGLTLQNAPAMAIEPQKFQLFTGAQLAADASALMAKPGNNNLVDIKSATVVMTTETAKSAKEFEWHAGRDHILQVLDGSTMYELGGMPSGTHANANGKAGEYNSTGSQGAAMVMLNKGDMLVIPRGTPHKRTTEKSVTFLLISSQEIV